LADIVGPVCESGDFLGRKRKIQESKRGEYLAVMSAGLMEWLWHQIIMQEEDRLKFLLMEISIMLSAAERLTIIFCTMRRL